MSVVKRKVMRQMGSIVIGAGSSTGWGRVLALLAMASCAPLTAACGSVAGPDYVGEVTLDLRGRVASLGTDQSDLVPALAFFTPEGFYLVDGEVNGEFPDHFTFRVAEPPPKAAFRDIAGDDSGALGAFGYLVMVTKDHGEMFAFDEPSISISPLDEETDPVTGEKKRSETNCSKDGTRCETLNYVCKSEPCESLVTESVDVSAHDISGFYCRPGACLTYQVECIQDISNLDTCLQQGIDVNDCLVNSSCTRSLQLCDTSSPAKEYIWSSGSVELCELVSREGVRPADGQWSDVFAKDLNVVFVTEAVEADGVQLEQGYNLLRSLPADDIDTWVKEVTCRIDADEFSADYESSEELTARHEEVGDMCRLMPEMERISNTAEVELEIELGAPGEMY